MCKVFEDIKQEGLEEGLAKTAKRLLTKGGYTPEEIAEVTDLPLEMVRELAAKLANS